MTSRGIKIEREKMGCSMHMLVCGCEGIARGRDVIAWRRAKGRVSAGIHAHGGRDMHVR